MVTLVRCAKNFIGFSTTSIQKATARISYVMDALDIGAMLLPLNTLMSSHNNSGSTTNSHSSSYLLHV